MNATRAVWALYALIALPMAVTAADLGTHATIRRSGNPDFMASGPSWVSASAAGGGFAINEILMGYFFEVAGPEGFLPVPVQIDYLMAGRQTGFGIARSTLRVADGPTFSVGATTSQLTYERRGTLEMTVNSNAAYQVSLIAIAGTTAAPGDFGWAYSDPYIHIAADWLALHPGYQVNVTPGVLNVLTPVPEPASWLMLLTSGAFAWARRSRSGLHGEAPCTRVKA